MKIQFRTHENGGVCCCQFDDNREPILPAYPCVKCAAHYAARGMTHEIETRRRAYEARFAASVAAIDSTASATAIPPTRKDDLRDYSPPNPYQLRAAESTIPEDFESRWKAERVRELEATAAALDASAPRLKTLTAEELRAYAPPNGYALALALRAKEAR